MVNSLFFYYLGMCEPNEREQVDAHLEGCTACRSRLSALHRGIANDARKYETPFLKIVAPGLEESNPTDRSRTNGR